MKLKEGELIISQTGIKDLERQLSCPYLWMHRWVKGEVEFEPSEQMRKGTYFEYLVLGENAHSEGEEDPPEHPTVLKSGKKSASEERIEKQAEYCKSILYDKKHENYLGIVPFQKQKTIEWGDKRGVVDLYGRREDSGKDVHVDLKFTSDVNSVFGPYSWGEPEGMDFFQQLLYSYIWWKNNGVIPDNVLLVFDDKKEMGKRMIELDITEDSFAEVEERLESFETAISHYNENGWTKYPSLDECNSCPLVCEKRFKTDVIKKSKIKL